MSLPLDRCRSNAVFVLCPQCWVAATTEAFLTWGLLGTSAMQIASHNKQKKFLQRDSSLVIIFTVSMLLLAAFLANMCVALLYANGLNYVPSSFGESPALDECNKGVSTSSPSRKSCLLSFYVTDTRLS